jgi:hypothetical protein
MKPHFVDLNRKCFHAIKTISNVVEERNRGWFQEMCRIHKDTKRTQHSLEVTLLCWDELEWVFKEENEIKLYGPVNTVSLSVTRKAENSLISWATNFIKDFAPLSWLIPFLHHIRSYRTINAFEDWVTFHTRRQKTDLPSFLPTLTFLGFFFFLLNNTVLPIKCAECRIKIQIEQ